MYLIGDSFRVSFKWVVIIGTKQEAAHTQSVKVSTFYTLWQFGDWSLIMERGGSKYRAGASEVLPLQKGGGGAENVLAVLKGGGGTKRFQVVLTRELEDLAIVMAGGAQKQCCQPSVKNTDTSVKNTDTSVISASEKVGP